jgi:hypothetical protein
MIKINHMDSLRARLFQCALAIAAMLPCLPPARGQEAGDSTLRTRQLWDTTLLNRRPVSAQKPAAKATLPSGSSQVKGALIGLTVWRLRPSKPGDSAGMRALIQEDATNQQWTPERIASGTRLIEGQRVRISVEAAESGFLYVFDRDEYADGAKGDSYLIFPTLRERGGDNRIAPGAVVEIPASDDSPPYFKVQRSRPNQTDEVLTIVVTPQPLRGLEIGRQRLKIEEARLAAWEREWRTKSSHLEAPAQEGKAYTAAEKEAGKGQKLLTQNDPTPQTMYEVDAKQGEAAMVQLRLKIAQ